MNWTTPWLLAALAALPAVYFLLRALPPAPRRQSFPALRLLAGLTPPRETVARASPWLLLLRLLAFSLLVVGLAGPFLLRDGGPAMHLGGGPEAIVIDNGWPSAGDWTQRQQAASAAIETMARAGRTGWLIATADLTPPDRSSSPEPLQAPLPGPLPAATLRGALSAIRPQAWPPQRAELAHDLAALPADTAILYLADGVSTSADDALDIALRRFDHVVTLRNPVAAPLLIAPPKQGPNGIDARVLRLPGVSPTATIIAGDTDGHVLATAATDADGLAQFALPSELRNRITRLTVAGAGAGGVRLLDEAGRSRPVGLLGRDSEDTPLLGRLYYLRRALGDGAELREGDLTTLLARDLSVVIAPDGGIGSLSRDDRHRLAAWIKAGGTLVRFAGPHLAHDTTTTLPDGDGDAARAAPAAPPPDESLLPVPLLGGARELGGAMSWEKAQSLAPWPSASPFAGLPVPQDIKFRKQVLAAPNGTLDAATWARLSDGTPLVTHVALGRGQLVLFHTTSNADWSDLPLSGLFVDMLHRLIQRSAGFSVGSSTQAVLPPMLTLDGSGGLTSPPAGAQGLRADLFGKVPASRTHPPGLYGPTDDRRALNLADTLDGLTPQKLPGSVMPLASARQSHSFGPLLAALGLMLLIIDQFAVVILRGWRPWRTGRTGVPMLVAGLVLGLASSAHAQTPPASPPAVLPAVPAPPQTATGADSPGEASADLPQGALHTTLAYIRTGDAGRDEMLHEGLSGLAAYTTARTSANIAPPMAVTPGQDDLAYYPVIYWAVSDTPPDPKMIAALNAYLAHGGMLLIDSHAGDAALGPDALRRATEGLEIPPLSKLDDHHVLAHTFYLLHDFPGRWADAPVWVASASVGTDDEIVSPVVIGAGGWAGAWAVDAQGQTPYAAIPGGESQRRTAYRFGVNLLIYALTGTYKADQAKVPALLERLGQ